MEITELLGVIFAGSSLLLLVGFLGFILIYLANDEKQHKLLINKELNARINFYIQFLDYLKKEYK